MLSRTQPSGQPRGNGKFASRIKLKLFLKKKKIERERERENQSKREELRKTWNSLFAVLQ
jgi:hypothetical protein